MLAADRNRPVFDFLRNRHAVVSFHAQKHDIETCILWGAVAETVARIHAAMHGTSLKQSRPCFVAGLINLEPILGTISVPLLVEDAKLEAPQLAHSSFTAYSNARRYCRIWSSGEDVDAHGELVTLRGRQPPKIQRLFDRNRYAEILYREYRCAVVHGLELGARVGTTPTNPRSQISYMNHMDKFPTRITFAMPYLCELLWNLLHKQEQQCSEAGWPIPPAKSLLR